MHSFTELVFSCIRKHCTPMPPVRQHARAQSGCGSPSGRPCCVVRARAMITPQWCRLAIAISPSSSASSDQRLRRSPRLTRISGPARLSPCARTPHGELTSLPPYARHTRRAFSFGRCSLAQAIAGEIHDRADGLCCLRQRRGAAIRARAIAVGDVQSRSAGPASSGAAVSSPVS